MLCKMFTNFHRLTPRGPVARVPGKRSVRGLEFRLPALPTPEYDSMDRPRFQMNASGAALLHEAKQIQ